MFASTALIAALVKSKAFPTNNAHAEKPLQLSREAVESVAEQLKSTLNEDAASTAGSQTTIVDEDAALQLQSRIKNAIQVLFHSKDNVRLLDANHAVDYVAYGLSDLVFVYPGSAGNYLGHQLKDWQTSIRNSRGDLVKVIEMETRAGALQAVQGAIENNNKTASVLTSSQALLSMIPNIHALALARQPVVFHVGAFSVDENLVAYSQVDAVLAARNSGAIVLSSSNVQEAHDIAIAAHLIATAAGLPVIHYFDGAASDIQKVSLYSYDKLASLSTTTTGDAYAVVENILGQFGYKTFEYTGATDAETVLVSLGASVASVSHAVQRAAAKNNKVGLVTVRAYRPWTEAGFIASLPSSTRHVVVLEQTDGLFAFNGPLFWILLLPFVLVLWLVKHVLVLLLLKLVHLVILVPLISLLLSRKLKQRHLLTWHQKSSCKYKVRMLLNKVLSSGILNKMEVPMLLPISLISCTKTMLPRISLCNQHVTHTV